MKSIFEDNNYSFSSFITSTTHTDGYAALIYRDEVTDDYSQNEQPIQSLFFHYLEPQSSGQVGEFTGYVGAEFFIGHGKTPLLALADASEQCEAYYKAQKENVEVALVGDLIVGFRYLDAALLPVGTSFGIAAELALLAG